MEKETSNAAAVVDDFETPKSNLSIDFPVDSLSFSVENLSFKNGDQGSSSPTESNSLAFNNGECPASKPQETSPDIQVTGLEKSRMPVPTPLFPDSIWAVKNNSTINGGKNYLGSFHGYDNMNYQSNNNDGTNNSALQGSQEEKSCKVGQDSTPDTQNKESFHNCGVKLQGFIMFANSERGSKNLQGLLAPKKAYYTSKILERVTALFDEIPVICYLMIDEHGYHVCSKMIDSCDDQQLALILESITRFNTLFVEICCSIHGSKMIKKLIKRVKRSPLKCYLTVALCTGFYQLVLNQTGSYVVIFCLDCLEVKQNLLLYEAAISHCLLLATDAIGCVSLNNFIDRIQGSHRQTLLELISSNAVFLSQDPSGNHVVQKVLGLENPIFSAKIGDQLRGHYVKLSFQKWGSHVVEKCLASQAMSFAVQELTSCSSSQLLQIARDQFGNYVIQKALKVSKQKNVTLHLKLLKTLEPNLDALQNGYGKKVHTLIINGIPLDESVNEV